jgi:hypothetical protein
MRSALQNQRVRAPEPARAAGRIASADLAHPPDTSRRCPVRCSNVGGCMNEARRFSCVPALIADFQPSSSAAGARLSPRPHLCLGQASP